MKTASPGACVPQFLKNKPCCWMKCNQVPWQTVPRAYKASNSCLPPAETHLGHRLFTIIIIRPAPSAMGMTGTDLTPPVPRQQVPECSQAWSCPAPAPGTPTQKSRSTPVSFLSLLLTIKRKNPLCLATAQREGWDNQPGGRSLLIPRDIFGISLCFCEQIQKTVKTSNPFKLLQE